MATSEEKKAAREKRVMESFVQKANIPIPPLTIENRGPPEPDIYCIHDEDGQMYFELVEVANSQIKELTGRRKNVPEGMQRISDDSGDILHRKLGKTYTNTNNIPIDLLCYWSGGIILPDDVIIPIITEELSRYSKDIIFRRVWYFGENEICQLWPLGDN